jgi:hypothetical protein
MTFWNATDESKSCRVQLRFDDKVDGGDYGSPEHFYHFMWGYLLPAMYEILQRLGTGERCETFVFTTCGPKMDPLIGEVARYLGIDFAIEDRSLVQENESTFTVPRWDLYILRPHLLRHSSNENIRITRMRDAFQRSLPEVWEIYKLPDFVANLRSQVIRVRDTFLRCLKRDLRTPKYDGLRGRYLILRREEAHPFYAEGGGAKILHYGASRRQLRGIDDALRVLEMQGFEVSVLIAGNHDLMGQALAFHHCRGIAMIRGAEIANLIWVRPGTPLLVLTPSNVADFPPPHDMLAELMGVKLTHIITEDRNSVLDPSIARQAWAAVS